jgi:hypothetical protein
MFIGGEGQFGDPVPVATMKLLMPPKPSSLG